MRFIVLKLCPKTSTLGVVAAEERCGYSLNTHVLGADGKVVITDGLHCGFRDLDTHFGDKHHRVVAYPTDSGCDVHVRSVDGLTAAVRLCYGLDTEGFCVGDVAAANIPFGHISLAVFQKTFEGKVKRIRDNIGHSPDELNGVMFAKGMLGVLDAVITDLSEEMFELLKPMPRKKRDEDDDADHPCDDRGDNP